MKYYKSTENKPFAFEDNATDEVIANVAIKHNTELTAITEEEFKAMQAPTFEQLQSAKLSEIVQAYTNANQEDIAYMNTAFDTKDSTQDIIAKNLAIGSVPDGFYFRDVDNNDVQMTYADLQGFGAAIQVRNLSNFSKYQELKTSVGSATAQDELDTIVW